MLRLADAHAFRFAANPEVLYLHNSSVNARPLKPAGAPESGLHAWAAEPDACPDGADGCAALAFFNAGNATSQVIVDLASVRLGSAPAQLCGRNLWTRRPLKPTTMVDVFAPKVRCSSASLCRLACALMLRACNSQLPPHGAALYVLWRSQNCTPGDEMFAPSRRR